MEQSQESLYGLSQQTNSQDDLKLVIKNLRDLNIQTERDASINKRQQMRLAEVNEALKLYKNSSLSQHSHHP